MSLSSPRRLNSIYKGRIFYRIIFFISSTLLLPLLLPFCPVTEENSKCHSAAWGLSITHCSWFLALHTSFCVQLQAFTGALTLWHWQSLHECQRHNLQEMRKKKKKKAYSISQPRQTIKEECEGEGNQSYIIDQKFCHSKEREPI